MLSIAGFILLTIVVLNLGHELGVMIKCHGETLSRLNDAELRIKSLNIRLKKTNAKVSKHRSELAAIRKKIKDL